MSFFSSFFPPKFDPKTPIILWSITIIKDGDGEERNRTITDQSTWGQYGKKLFKLFNIPSHNFGIDEPIIYVVVRSTENVPDKLMTRDEFEKKYGTIPVRTAEERKVWSDQLLVKLTREIAEIKIKILREKIKLIEQSLESSNLKTQSTQEEA